MVLDNRLKRILPKIITTKHQSAFTKNHLIFENIKVAFETLHSMQHHILIKDGFMALKSNMSKVYDRVKWSFLESVIRKTRFNEYWIFFFFLVNALCQNSLLLYFSQWGTKRFYQAKQGVLEKVILFPLSYFSYTLKGSTILFLKRLNKILFMDCLWVQEVLSWPIFYLQMAAFYSINLHLRNVRKCWISWGFMRGV